MLRSRRCAIANNPISGRKAERERLARRIRMETVQAHTGLVARQRGPAPVRVDQSSRPAQDRQRHRVHELAEVLLFDR